MQAIRSCFVFFFFFSRNSSKQGCLLRRFYYQAGIWSALERRDTCGPVVSFKDITQYLKFLKHNINY